MLGEHGKIWLIDHGICFHVESKLRTVVWDFVGENIPADLMSDLVRFGDDLATQGDLVRNLAKFLSQAEIGAMRERVETLVRDGTFPKIPEDQRAVPWPLV